MQMFMGSCSSMSRLPVFSIRTRKDISRILKVTSTDLQDNTRYWGCIGNGENHHLHLHIHFTNWGGQSRRGNFLYVRQKDDKLIMFCGCREGTDVAASPS